MKYTLLIFSIVNFSLSLAQTDADDLLSDLTENVAEDVIATFKSSRIINGHSIEQPDKGEMEFRISHRFGRVNGGFQELYGLDQAFIHFSLEYSPIKVLTLGIGRGNQNKTFDGFAKVSILKQTKGARNFPFFLTYFASIEMITIKNNLSDYRPEHNLSYVHQLLIARKFTKRLSLQLTPSYVHRNLVTIPSDPNDIFSLGIGGRFKITKRLSFNAETFLIEPYTSDDNKKYYIPISFGIDLETGGHVFQIMATNSRAMREGAFIGQTDGFWPNGDIHLGFNVSRMFNLSK